MAGPNSLDSVLWVHVHIPKTGGTSLDMFFRSLSKNTTLPGVRCCEAGPNDNSTQQYKVAMTAAMSCDYMAAEWSYATVVSLGLVEPLSGAVASFLQPGTSRRVKLITMVRSPQQLLRSMIEHNIRHADRHPGMPANASEAARQAWKNYYAFIRGAPQSGVRGYNLVNPQAARLLPARGVGFAATDVEPFLRSTYAWVGVTDYMMLSMCALQYLLFKEHTRVPDMYLLREKCSCAHNDLLVASYNDQRATHDSGSSLGTQYTSEELRLFSTLNHFDGLVFAHAVGRLMQTIGTIHQQYPELGLSSCLRTAPRVLPTETDWRLKISEAASSHV